MFTDKIRTRFISCLAAIVFMLAFAAGISQAKAPASVTVKLVQITDDHFDPFSERVNLRMVKYSKNLLDDAIDQINRMKGISFVIFTGDLADTTDENLHVLFADEANKLNVPWYWTTGNHDLGQSEKTNDRRNFLKMMNLHNKYIQPESTCYSFTAGGILFFAMDGANDKTPSAKGFFSKECLGYLDTQLSANSAMPAVIFQHFPLVYPIKSEGHETTNDAEYLALIDKHSNVKAVISGHYHVPKIQKRNKVLHISSPSLIQYPNAFSVITLVRTGSELKIDDKIVETRLKDVQQMSKDSKK